MLEELQIERYARHILLREVGGIGQERILAARLTLEGLGETGVWAATYLALAGIGHLRLFDPREVPASGLLPMIPTSEAGRRRDEALASILPSHNPDVAPSIDESGIEAAEGASFVRASMVGRAPCERTGDAVWIRLDGTFFAAAVGEVAVVGWLGAEAPCLDCIAAAGPPIPYASAAAALAGSLAASAILASILDPRIVRPGLVIHSSQGAIPLPPCPHAAPPPG